MESTVIRTRDLSRHFQHVRAVDGISFEVPPGIVFGFLGPNGSGKTTTIRLLLGLLQPTAGEAEVFGLNVQNQADQIRARSGALLEHTGLYERISAQDNLEFYARVWRMPAADRRARIQELLSGLGLWERRSEPVGAWSRGMKQKLAVGRALLHRPELIFLDEPTAGLDPVAAAALREDLARIVQQTGATVFLTTHNLAEAEKLCAQVAVIRQGKLLAVGSPDQLRKSSGAPRLEINARGLDEGVLAALRARPEVAGLHTNQNRLTLELNGDPDTAPLIQLLVSSGVQIDEVQRGKASLEEVFLTLMEEEK